ncbi:hypothetical protein [Rhizobacter sp. SG703]|uniref:hypothetical protein n=1 Tax=Rhizobacter sp. SG703 TaxID=2587140 RepID=UPI001446D8EB|nr:hypothetical protein [Rhizobacter sp. SG703]NKI96637.1 hypothetical protein [Rhizobacter sp. SG703]
MTKYQELAALAVVVSQREYSNAKKCEYMAHQFVREYATFLGCSTDKFRLVEVDEELKATPATFAIAPAGLVGTLKMPSGHDGYRYVRVRLKYETAAPNNLTESFNIGLAVNGAAARIVYSGTEFDFDPQNASPTLAPLFERIAGETLQTLSSPTPNRSRIGF